MNNKLNYSYKKQKGVTLIALVITILVLLILAGVSITALVGEKGIVGQAKIAKHETNKAGLREEADLVLIDREGKERGEKNKLKEDLEAGISGNKTVKEVTNSKGEIYPDICIVTRDGATITVYEEGTIIDDEIDIWDGISKKEPQIDKEKNWHIYTTEELSFFKDFVNGKLSEEEKAGLEITPETTVYLENNLDLGARVENGQLVKGTEWEAIGKENEFIGIFEGNNHIVTGIYVNGKSHEGFFGKANTIKNLTIENSYIKGEIVLGGIVGQGKEIINCNNINTDVISEVESRFIGGIVGQAVGERVENCTNSGNVKGLGTNSNNYSSVGGIAGAIGYTNGPEIIVKNCKNTGKIEGNHKYVGGITGFINKKVTVQECINEGEIIGRDGTVGGIAGQANYNIISCKNFGNISGKIKAGGIAGHVYTNIEINECYNSGKITGNEITGGIAGVTFANVINSRNEGEVISKKQVGGITGVLVEAKITKTSNIGEVTGDNRIGGICGEIGARTGSQEEIIGNIEGNYNSGKITGNTDYVGGIVGIVTNNKGKINNNYNTGEIKVPNSITNTGEIIGIKPSGIVLNNNYYNSDIIKINSSNNYPEQKNGARTTNQMKEDNFINELNEGLITEVWKKDTRLENDGYPIIIK